MMGMPIHVRRAWSARVAGPALAASAVLILAAVLVVILWLPASAARAADVEANPAQLVDSLPAVDQTSGSPQLLAAAPVSEWDHVLQVVAWLRYRAPQRRVVYLFGGSAARESVISESSWAAQVRAVSGGSAVTYVISSRCQTYVEDTIIVNQLPEGRGVALISVGPTRFTMLHEPASVPQDSARSWPPGPWFQHHYDRSPSLSGAEKRNLVKAWVQDRYGVFLSRYPDRLIELDTLVQACLARGLRPVLLEMPLNLPVIGHAFDDARVTYQTGCLELAAKYDIEYVRFVSDLGLRGTDFYDLQHLLPSGRSKWQARLSQELVWRQLL